MCKRETGEEHLKLIQVALDAIEKQRSRTRIRTISIASDGESKRGRALAMLTMKKQLSFTSPIYPQLQGLRYMNLLVGDDDITCDKDYKHLFKRLRNLLLRQRGVTVFNTHLTPATIRAHLREAGHSVLHVNALFKPEDKQDVKLAYELLSAIWKLPEAPVETTPGFKAQRCALHTLGLFLRCLLYPFICVNLSLREQMEYLSAASHLGLVLFRAAKQDFLPSLLYSDIQIMIKNVFVCVAKAKVDNPDGVFFIIFLGTDRLEIHFGILRTQIGNDANMDQYQLASRITGTTEVANILAEHPEWDRSPRRLKLPALSNSGEVDSKIDHINPKSWRGNVSVREITLLTAWRRGRLLVEGADEMKTSQHHEYCMTILAQIDEAFSRSPSCIDILQPFGSLIAHPEHTLDPSDNEFDDDSNASTSEGSSSALPCTFEDALAEEDMNVGRVEHATSKTFDRFVTDKGQKVNKARMIGMRTKYQNHASSTDRLKRVQSVGRYNSQALDGISNSVMNTEAPGLMLHEPIATILRCEGKLFLALGEVISITAGSEAFEQISLDIIGDDSVNILYQLVYLIPTLNDDSLDPMYDWKSTRQLNTPRFKIPGRLLQAINPNVSVTDDDKRQPCYTFDSSVLVSLAADLLLQLAPQDAKLVPRVSLTKDFPYRTAGRCFMN